MTGFKGARRSFLPGSRRRRQKVDLTVVVPAHNVEQYLDECLESLRSQDPGLLQVVIVDDGSTDRTARIAARQAGAFPDWRLVRTANRGLGAARNTGLDLAVGRYLAFLDADDTVPAGAYRRMIQTLDRTGSDFAVGGIYRTSEGRRREPHWARELHSRDRLAVRVVDHPEVLRDFYTPNKVFRTSFWARHGLRFREGVLFEDQPLITLAYALASSVDILGGFTYHWREREDRSSLSQAMFSTSAIRQRQQAIELTRIALDDWNPRLRTGWLRTLLQRHLPHYLSQVPDFDDDQFLAVVALARAAVTESELLSVPGVPPTNRALCQLALLGERGLLERFLADRQHVISRLPTRRTARGIEVCYTTTDGRLLAVLADPALRALEPRAVAVHAGIERIWWAGPCRLVVEGRLFIPGVSAVGAAGPIDQAVFLEGNDDERLPALVRPPTGDVAAAGGSSSKTVDDRAFRAEFDLSWLPGRVPPDVVQREYGFGFSVGEGGNWSTTRVLATKVVESPFHDHLADGNLGLFVEPRDGGRLVLRATRRQIVLAAASVEGSSVRFRLVAARGTAQPVALRLPPDLRILAEPEGETRVARVPLAALSGRHGPLRAELDGGGSRIVFWSQEASDAVGAGLGGVFLGVGGRGAVLLTSSDPGLTLEAVEVAPDVLRLRPSRPVGALVAVAGAGPGLPLAAAEGGWFELHPAAGVVEPGPGPWRLVDAATGWRLSAAPSLAPLLPLRVLVGGTTVEVAVDVHGLRLRCTTRGPGRG